MKKGSLSFTIALTTAVAVGLISLGAVQAANLRRAPGPVAAMLRNGAVYVTATNDNFWHQVSPSTLARLGYTTNNIKWYSSLPGTIAPQATSSAQRIADLSRPPVTLAGLMGTGRLYVAHGDLFYPITAAALLKDGYSLSWVKWYGSLPGSIARST